MMIKINSMFLFGPLFSFLSVGNFASAITIEPDDYALGTDLSNVSPYVTLQSACDGASNPVRATAPNLGTSAPTGNLTFGDWGIGSGYCDYPNLSNDGIDLTGFVGLGMYFHQTVSHVSLMAVNDGYRPGLSANWVAFDNQGHRIGSGSSGQKPLGENFLLDIQMDGISTLVVGGADTIPAISFDYLVFDVPEPSSLALLAIGVLGIAVVRPKRK